YNRIMSASLRLRVDPDDPMPLYAQLERAIRAAISGARLNAGQQLPTVRELAVELRVNANTVARVYAALEAAEVLETRRGVGTFVRAWPPGARPTAERERRLRDLEERFLAECMALGFNAED